MLDGNCSKCSWTYQWTSQPMIQHTPAGNLLLSSSVLFSGLTPTVFWRALSFLNMELPNVRQFFRHQSEYLIPVVVSTWRRSQTAMLDEMKDDDDGVHVCTDMRCDTPGMFNFSNRYFWGHRSQQQVYLSYNFNTLKVE